MASRLEQLAQRQRDLQLKCALQRQHMTYLTQDIEERLVGTDRVLNVAGFVLKNPTLLVGTLAFTLIAGPWRIFKWVSKGAMLWSLAHKVRLLLDK